MKRLLLLLLCASFSLQAFAPTKESQLIEAASRGDLGDVKDFLKQGASINALSETTSQGDNALMAASRFGYVSIVNYLLDQGANPNLKNNQGESTLSIATRKANKKIVEALIDYGANVKDDKEALVNSILSGALDVFKLLLANGASVEGTAKAFVYDPQTKKMIEKEVSIKKLPSIQRDILKIRVLKAERDMNIYDRINDMLQKATPHTYAKRTHVW